MTFTAGAKLRASEVNNALPLLAATSVDLSRTSSTTLTDATGLAVALAANSVYAIDAYLGYTASETGDLKLAVAAPTGATGHWAALGLASSVTGGTTSGSFVAIRRDGFGDASTLAVGGSNNAEGGVACQVRAYVATAGTAGNFQLRYAQNTSSGTSTVLKAGTWLRAWKIA